MKVKWKGTVGLIAMILMLSACGKEEVKEVQLGEVARSIFYAPLYAGIEKGFFEEEGLAIDVTTIPGGDKTMTALLSDGVDIALIGAETSIYVAGQNPNDPVVNFAQLTQTDGTFLVSREKVENFDWNMLKGTTFLGQRAGGMPQMAGEFVLKNNGINPQEDLTLIQNVDFANIPNAFASGTGDFVQLFEPTASIFEEQGMGTVVASFGEELGAIPYTVFMTKESTLGDKELIEGFTRALYKAQNWVYESSATEVAKAIAPYFEDTDLALIEKVVERYRDQASYAKDPIIDENEFENLLQVMKEANKLETDPDYTKLVNRTFAEEVVK
ncbi:ABC transporter substrate-binding protein [Paenisporosarcina cavernae]|uniref:ABC transporter substrate-binding protein n=1 Tax=Paenisporosarcina cavernae TaxID=2320858 RepID=A0A385YPA7_9BACL|nr:ABC transporter substrate-binding protein [Paenisporosarcina cavernae]AYC28416.1 ABC transporter substrate-binding protein [Paenisporosarcina cavernae]